MSQMDHIKIFLFMLCVYVKRKLQIFVIRFLKPPYINISIDLKNPVLFGL